MRRKLWVGKGTRALEVEALGIFENRVDAVLYEHVVRPIGLCRTGAVNQVQLPQGKLVARAVLKGFHGPRARQRAADEAQAYGFEFFRRQICRRISRPEAVTVTRDDRKASDFRVADQAVDLAALQPGAA